MREINIDQLPFVPTPTWDPTRNPGMCPTGNGTGDILVWGMVPNQLSNTRWGCMTTFIQCWPTTHTGLNINFLTQYILDIFLTGGYRPILPFVTAKEYFNILIYHNSLFLSNIWICPVLLLQKLCSENLCKLFTLPLFEQRHLFGHILVLGCFFFFIAIDNCVPYKLGQFLLPSCVTVSVALRICQHCGIFVKLVFANLKNGK